MWLKLSIFILVANIVGSLPHRRPREYQSTYPRLKVRDGYVPSRPDGHIVGGTPAVPYSFPWQVVLWINYNWFCSGSLISDTWVLTAAHCLRGFSTVEVVFGVNDPNANEDTQTSLRSDELQYHEDYGHILYTNDIGVIKLPQKVNYTEYIQPIALSPRDPAAGETVVITGWGFQSDDDYYLSDLADQLMELEAEVITDDECKEAFGARDWAQDVCLSGTGGIGSCNGDSGGPLHYTLEEGGSYVIAGICSFGASSSCEEGYPSAYTSVENYLDWIHNKTGVTPYMEPDSGSAIQPIYMLVVFSGIIVAQFLN